ncbi:MAG TPA: YncE family protein [Candidatus Sulfotelmatobacter sp.]
MNQRQLIFSFVLTIILGCTLQAQSRPQQSLLALSKKDQTLAIVDPSSLKVLARIPVGNDPHEVIASSDGMTAYVSNYGFGAYNSLAVIDLAGKKALPAIDLGPLRGPHGLTFMGGKVWFTAEAAKAIGSYDPKSGKVDWILGTGQDRTHMIWLTEDEKRIVTTNVSSGTVSIMDKVAPGPAGEPVGGPNNPPPRPIPPGGGWEQTVVKVGNGSEGFDVSPRGTEIWVANAQEGTISIVNLASKTVSDTIAANVPGANRLKFTPDGARVLVSSLRGGDLTIFDSSSRKEIKRVKLGHGTAGILIEPKGERAFVACSPDNYVAVIDLKSLEDVGHIDVGQNPDGLAWATVH